MGLIYTILSSLIIFAMCYWIVWGIVENTSFNDYKNDTDIKLTFKQFLDYYYLNPDNWDLERAWQNFLVYEKNSSNYYISMKSRIDFYKLKKFIRNQDKKNELERKNLKTADFLSEIQKDIDAKRRQANGEVEKFTNAIINFSKVASISSKDVATLGKFEEPKSVKILVKDTTKQEPTDKEIQVMFDKYITAPKYKNKCQYFGVEVPVGLTFDQFYNWIRNTYYTKYRKDYNS